MECVNTITTRPMERGCTLLYGIPSGRLWTRPRRLAFIHRHASWHSEQYSRCISKVYPIHRLHWGLASWRACAASVNLNTESSPFLDGDCGNGALEFGESEELITKQLRSDELMALLADSERAKLIRKLSDANQHNRFLKRQLQSRDDTLVDFKTELALLELELQTGSRKINGKYIQSHLLSRLEAAHQKVKEQIQDVDSLKFKEVNVIWVGMAESVQVMGSFDGWSKGEDMSSEYSGYNARFSATLKLRSGRYEIKFLVDGEWRLSPEFPAVGEEMTKNNLLIVS